MVGEAKIAETKSIHARMPLGVSIQSFPSRLPVGRRVAALAALRIAFGRLEALVAPRQSEAGGRGAAPRLGAIFDNPTSKCTGRAAGLLNRVSVVRIHVEVLPVCTTDIHQGKTDTVKPEPAGAPPFQRLSRARDVQGGNDHE